MRPTTRQKDRHLCEPCMDTAAVPVLREEAVLRRIRTLKIGVTGATALAFGLLSWLVAPPPGTSPPPRPVQTPHAVGLRAPTAHGSSATTDGWVSPVLRASIPCQSPYDGPTPAWRP